MHSYDSNYEKKGMHLDLFWIMYNLLPYKLHRSYWYTTVAPTAGSKGGPFDCVTVCHKVSFFVARWILFFAAAFWPTAIRWSQPWWSRVRINQPLAACNPSSDMMRLPMVGRILGVRRKERIIEPGWLHRYVVQSATLKSIGTLPAATLWPGPSLAMK